jgi:hypothetical protein
LVILSLLLTSLNCVKPLHVDDDAYVAFASHIADHPLSPYDFTIFWGYCYRPANQVLAPPVALYWLAAAQKLFGDDVAVWKMAFFPFNLLLSVSLYALFHRWAPRIALALTWTIVLSPAVLPATNLMLDIPALALGLAAIALLLRADEWNSWGLALAAGLVAGLAMQTKYTAFTVSGVFLAWGVTNGRIGRAVTAACVGAAVFGAWEAFVASQQGTSHFMEAMAQRGAGPVIHFKGLSQPLFALTAALSPGVLLACLAGLTRTWRALALTGLLLIAGFCILGIVPESYAHVRWTSPFGKIHFTLENLLYTCLTLFWWLIWIRTAYRGWRLQPMFASKEITAPFEVASRRGSRVLWFLGLWLAVEIAAYFVMSPFPAARRVLGVIVVTALIAGVALERLAPDCRQLWSAVCGGAAFALVLALIDMREAWAAKDTVEKIAQIVNLHQSGGRTWFQGVWGFQSYALRHGFEPLAPGHSMLRHGDLVVLADQQLNAVDFRPEEMPLQWIAVATFEDSFPWRTLCCYYGGPVPVSHHEGPRVRATVYRVEADFLANTYGVKPPVH